MLKNNQKIIFNNENLTEVKKDIYLKKIINEAFNLFKESDSNKINKEYFK